MSGQENEEDSIDKAQEHNIKDIKVTYRSEGPNIHWDYMKKLHPANHPCSCKTHREGIWDI